MPPASSSSAADDAELFLYPGDQHYFADSSLPSYDADATRLLTQRVLEFLARIDARKRATDGPDEHFESEN